MARFVLQFPPDRICALAAAYSYPDETSILTLGAACRQRGFLTRDDLLAFGLWKAARNVPRLAQNHANLVEEASRIALTAEADQLRIGVLRVLHGVDWPVASVLLHFCHHDRYPILDFRAFESLGVRPMPVVTFAVWWDYVVACRALADQHAVDMRTLDRALWQYSKMAGARPASTGPSV
jgi:hypothetical protein